MGDFINNLQMQWMVMKSKLGRDGELEKGIQTGIERNRDKDRYIDIIN